MFGEPAAQAPPPKHRAPPARDVPPPPRTKGCVLCEGCPQGLSNVFGEHQRVYSVTSGKEKRKLRERDRKEEGKEKRSKSKEKSTVRLRTPLNSR